jgi:two-component system, NarL family, invasion response regulator UvrY
MIRVFLADDHRLFREGLRRILDHTEGIQVVGEAGDGNAVMASAATSSWDVLVLDLNLPELAGIDVLRRLRASHPRMAILVLSMYAEDQYAARILRAGASGYLAKGRSSAELVDAIRKVGAGGRYVTSEVAEHLLDPKGGDDAPPHQSLSEREHQVFMLLAQGRSPSDIASELQITPSTVSTYIARIKRQLGAQTIGEIVRYASRVGLL